MQALGHTADPAAEGLVYLPDNTRQAIYRGAIARQQALYERLIGPGAAV